MDTETARRNAIRENQDVLLKKVARTWDHYGDIRIGVNGPTMLDLEAMIYPDLAHTVSDLIDYSMAVSSDRVLFTLEN